MKSKTIACNDNRGLDEMVNEFIKDKKIVFISNMIFVHGNFLINIFYYDVDLNLDQEVKTNITTGL